MNIYFPTPPAPVSGPVTSLDIWTWIFLFMILSRCLCPVIITDWLTYISLSPSLSLSFSSALPLSPCPNMLFFVEQEEYDPFWQHWTPDLSLLWETASWGVWLADALSPFVWITCRSWPLYSKLQSPSATCEHLQDLTWKAHSLLSDMALVFSDSYQVEGLPQNSSISSGKAYYFSQGKSETKTANSQTWEIVAWRT